jgi:ketosteroid isomerase-like protein
MHDPDVIMRFAEGWPEPGPFVGREAVMRQVRQMRDTWDSQTIELIGDFIHAGDRVVVRLAWHGRGHGPEAKVEATTVSTVRNGRVVALDFFWDHAEALETVGLTEQSQRPVRS